MESEHVDVKFNKSYRDGKDENRLSLEGAIIVSASRLHEVNEEIHNMEIESPTDEIMKKSIEKASVKNRRSFMTSEYIIKQISDVDDNIKPNWLIELLGTWKQYILVLFFLGVYFGCTYIAVMNGLL